MDKYIKVDYTLIREAPIEDNITCENIGTLAQCDQFICSNCGIHLQDWSSVDDDNGTLFEYNFNYCPNCGAKVKYEE